MPKKIVDEKVQIRDFGLALFVLLAVLGGLALYRNKPSWPYLFASAALICAIALFARPILRPVFRGWMRLAALLSWLMTRFILIIFYYSAFAPIGLFLRLCGKDLLDRKWNPAAKTYWRLRDDKEYDPKDTERMF